MAKEPRLPGPKDRLTVIGTTGSGKTVAALYHLSIQDLNARPWIVFDFKDDDNIALIEKAQHVGLDFRPKSDSRGIFVVHPMRTDDDEVNDMMTDLLKRGNVGIYVDEPDMNNASGFEDVLRKGRSHYVPVIALTQRPVDCNRYMLSEANFYRIFALRDERDWDTVRKFTPVGESKPKLEEFHSLFFDAKRDTITKLGPTPSVERIMQEFDR